MNESSRWKEWNASGPGHCVGQWRMQALNISYLHVNLLLLPSMESPISRWIGHNNECLSFWSMHNGRTNIFQLLRALLVWCLQFAHRKDRPSSGWRKNVCFCSPNYQISFIWLAFMWGFYWCWIWIMRSARTSTHSKWMESHPNRPSTDRTWNTFVSPNGWRDILKLKTFYELANKTFPERGTKIAREMLRR